MNKLTVAILLISLLTLSCHRNTMPQVITVVKDSTITKLVPVVRDTTVYLPGDTLMYYDTLPCPEAQIKAAVKGKQNRLDINLYKGILSVNCHTDSFRLRIQYLEMQLTKERYLNESKTVQVPVDVPVRVPFIPKIIWIILAISVLLNIWAYRDVFARLISHLIKPW
jgi:hypothetical protein